MFIKNCLFIICLLKLSFINRITATPLNHDFTYDQRQTGKYNIQLSIKDVSIISLDGDSLSNDLESENPNDFYEDYEYDINDFTISPISAALGSFDKPTTSTTTTTIKPSTTSPTKITTSTTKKPNVIIIPTNNNKPPMNLPASNSTTTTGKPSIITSKPLKVTTKRNMPSNNNDLNNKPYHSQHFQHEIPVQIIMEPSSKSIPHQQQQQQQNRQLNQPPVEMNKLTNDKIKNEMNIEQSADVQQQPEPLNNTTVNQQHKQKRFSRKCNLGEFRDRQGRCRQRRRSASSSMGLKYILNLLTYLTPRSSSSSSASSSSIPFLSHQLVE